MTIHRQTTRYFVGSRIILVGTPHIWIDAVQTKTNQYHARFFLVVETEGYTPEEFATPIISGVNADGANLAMLPTQEDHLDLMVSQALQFAKNQVARLQDKAYAKTQNHVIFREWSLKEQDRWADHLHRLMWAGMEKAKMQLILDQALSPELMKACNEALPLKKMMAYDVVTGI